MSKNFPSALVFIRQNDNRMRQVHNLHRSDRTLGIVIYVRLRTLLETEIGN